MPVKLFFRKSGGRRRNKEHLEENQIKCRADAYLRPIRRISVSYLTGTCEQLLFARRPFFFNPCRERLRSQLINLIPFNQLSPKRLISFPRTNSKTYPGIINCCTIFEIWVLSPFTKIWLDWLEDINYFWIFLIQSNSH